MIEPNAVVVCCHQCATPVKVVGEAMPGLTLVIRAKDGEPFVVPTDQVKESTHDS